MEVWWLWSDDESVVGCCAMPGRNAVSDVNWLGYVSG